LGSSPALVLHFPPAAPAALRDRLVALLADHGLLAIQEDDIAAPRQWIAHFTTADARDDALAMVGALPETRDLRVEPVAVEDEDWARRTQASLPAVRIGRLIVAPPWDLPASSEAGAGEIVVEIEPSRGFGTGHHESTRLCLLLLQRVDLAGRSLLDVGTGSGVLAIAGARLGASPVTAIDIDADALENVGENLARNRLAGLVDARVQDFTADPPLPPAHIVTANLTGTLLARHASQLARLVAGRGVLLVSGFTVDERHLVEAAFAPEFGIVDSAEEAGWWAFALSRTAPAARRPRET